MFGIDIQILLRNRLEVKDGRIEFLRIWSWEGIKFIVFLDIFF